MPNATITSTASTFGTISGTFAADQSTVTGTIAGTITGTLDGSVGVPGPAGPTGPQGDPGEPGQGVPVGGDAGQALVKIDGTNYNTEWSSLPAFLTKASNLGDLPDFEQAQDNLALGKTNDVTFFALYTVSGDFRNYLDANGLIISDHGTLNNLWLKSDGIQFTDSTFQTTAFPGFTGYAPLASPVFTGNPTAPTPATNDNDTSIATTAFVKAQGYITSAPVTSVAGRTGAITLANTDISGLGSLAVVNDAPSNGSQYARKNAAWEVVTTTPDFITSVTAPLAVTTGNLTVDLSTYAPLASPALTGNPTSVTPAIGDNDTSIATTAFVKAQGYFYKPSIAWTYGAPAIDETVINFSLGTTSNNFQFFASTTSYIENDNVAIVSESASYNLTKSGLSLNTYPLYNGQNPSSPTVGGELNYDSETAVLTLRAFTAAPTDNTITIAPTGITFPDTTVQTTAAVTPDLSGYAPLASPVFTGNPTAPTPATSDNDTSIATTAYVKAQDFGDRYLTTSTTSNTIGNGNKTFTIGTGLSYTPTQNITISYDAANHMHGEVLTYSTSTGVLTVDINHHTGSGTYAAWVVNVGGVTPATSVAFSDITGAVSGNVNLQAALDLKANLASPTFSGTPSLPTGTTGITQTAGNNTTALATTAFVTTSNPDASTTVKGHVELATNAEALTSTSTTLAITPSTVPWAISNGMIQRLDFINNTSISGSGAVTTSTAGYRQIFLSTALSVGRASFSAGSIGSFTITPGLDDYRQINFSKKMWVCGKFACNFPSLGGDANNFFSISLGGYTTNSTGNMNVKGIGLKKLGGTASVIELVVHNGTSQATVATTRAIAVSEVVEWMIYSDGTGNVTLYINGTQEATSSAGPTGATANAQGVYREQVEQTITAATRLVVNCHSGQLIIER